MLVSLDGVAELIDFDLSLRPPAALVRVVHSVTINVGVTARSFYCAFLLAHDSAFLHLLITFEVIDVLHLSLQHDLLQILLHLLVGSTPLAPIEQGDDKAV